MDDRTGTPGAAAGLRRLLMALYGLGTVALTAELLLLEHVESWLQWIPLAALGAGALAMGALAARPGPRLVWTARITMWGLVLVGGLGLYLHFHGNRAFELEMEPGLAGLALLSKTLRGATPALAPGALAQLGLIGLLATYRHPAAAG